MKCAFPPCPVQIESGGDSPPVFCEKHLAVKCNYPPCQETIAPNADVCLGHLRMVQEFDWIHAVRHTQVARQQALAQQNAEIMRKIQGNGGDPGTGPGGLFVTKR